MIREGFPDGATWFRKRCDHCPNGTGLQRHPGYQALPRQSAQREVFADRSRKNRVPFPLQHRNELERIETESTLRPAMKPPVSLSVGLDSIHRDTRGLDVELRHSSVGPVDECDSAFSCSCFAHRQRDRHGLSEIEPVCLHSSYEKPASAASRGLTRASCPRIASQAYTPARASGLSCRAVRRDF